MTSISKTLTRSDRPVRSLIKAVLCGLLWFGIGLGVAEAQAPAAKSGQQATRVEIDEGVIQPIPIAISIGTVSQTGAQGGAYAGIGQQIAQVVAADLERSGYFAPIDPAAFIQHDLDVNIEPRYEDWQTIHALDLVNGAARIDADGRLQVDFRLWDVFNKKQLIGQNLAANPENWRRIAHKIADLIYETLTGYEGYFDTRIVFVCESGKRGARTQRMCIMDQDGFGPQPLTDGSQKIMSPRFSADGQQIAYMALSADTARIFIFDIETNRQESLGPIRGMVFAPRFSPDGTKLAFTVDQGGNSDIYVMDLRSRQLRRLTRDPGIDTSPSFSPDGSQIVFNSDRGGSPQLYVMNEDGSNVHRLSFGAGRYTTPVYSPKGDLIAFTKQSEGRFSIGVMKPDGSDERLLTSSYLEEGPSWAPNGRYIIFYREPMGGMPSLWMVDVTGRIEKPVPYTGGGSDPAWSPRLK